MFIACKKYEDQSIAYVAKCKTSSSSLKTTLTGLYQAKQKLEAVSSKASSISQAEAKAESRSKRFAITSADTMISALQAFITQAQSLDTDEIGTDSTMREYATNISATNTLSLSFTSVQISAASTIVTQITVIVVQELSMTGIYFKAFFSLSHYFKLYILLHLIGSSR